ncbi:MAG: cobyrinic acid a,c-diamide synthase [Bacillus thermozeamaize]|uniref:Cobyrinate a,c-diamide synthase n=1 Tax=Bacillus thermozeamaize TaxID=230954 RepID=A0A1Y3PVZ9_9BACI|nr:MAG: cobyrinic acid a,c-diamide synthase [Bacillus thermozeamaize]
MTEKRIVIAGTGSGVGKTTLTLGLMAALKKRGYTVQGFKCGPDYIDPTYHTAVTGRPSRNLDSWMFDAAVVRAILHRGSEGADISIIEGVMGFYDGKSPLDNRGSTAEISLLTESPVLLVVNCHSMARSAAAVVKGFQTLEPAVKIAGVVANQVGSKGHFRLVQQAIEQECGIPVIGYLERNGDLHMPERHLGLVPAIERGELDAFFDRLAGWVSRTVDLEQVLALADAAPLGGADTTLFQPRREAQVQIAVARDAAFHFYYPENLELLEAYGAKLVYFSPLAGEPVPAGSAGLYIGGGFPEEFVAELAGQTQAKASVKEAIERGMPALAECGGFMYLTEAIETTDGDVHHMVGIIPGKVKMQDKLAALGYREVEGEEGNYLLPDGATAKGHEFHYSVYEPQGDFPAAYRTTGLRGTKAEGIQYKRLIAGYTHLHFASAPELVERWIQACLEWQNRG